jgi:hypothetical protein
MTVLGGLGRLGIYASQPSTCRRLGQFNTPLATSNRSVKLNSRLASLARSHLAAGAVYSWRVQTDN